MADFQLAKNAAKALHEDFDNRSSCQLASSVLMFLSLFRRSGLISTMRKKITLPKNPKSDLDDLPKNFLSINDYAAAPTHAEVINTVSRAA